MHNLSIVFNKTLKDKVIPVLILLLMFLFWNVEFNFFWRDEWLLLQEFKTFNIKAIFKPLTGHIMPISNVMYFFAMSIFKASANGYQYLGLVIYSLAILGVYNILIHSLGNYNFKHLLSCIITLVILSHPINFNHLLSSLYMCQSLFLAFQIFAVYFFLLYFNEQKRIFLALTFLFVFLQNYSFGNGIFFPTVFILYFMLFKRKNQRNLLFFFFIQIVFIIVQLIFGSNGSFVKSNSINDVIFKLISLIKFIDINVIRTINVVDYLHIKAKLLGIIILLGITVFGYYSSNVDKKRFSIYLFWFLTSCITIPMARNIQDNSVIPQYYSVMSLIPFSLMIVELLLPNINFFSKYYKLITSFGIIILIGFYVVDRKMEKVFSSRNLKNFIKLQEATKNDGLYLPFDDPCFVNGQNTEDPSLNVKIIYNDLLKE